MIRRVLILCILALMIAPTFAQESTVVTETGALNNDTPTRDYPLTLAAGDVVIITAEATRGDLDTTLTLTDANGQVVANNDDRTPDILDSAIGYESPDGGSYTLTIARYDEAAGSSYGEFRLTITTGDRNLFALLDELTGIELSGTRLTLDTEHFRIHYTLSGRDRVTDEYLQAVARAFEEFHRIEIGELGWAAPPLDGSMGGNDLYDVYIKDLIGRGEGALGYTSPRMIVGDNPNTPEVETNAAASLIAIDNDFDDTETDNRLGLMRATIAHEYHHAIQFGYDTSDAHGWFYEATAAWMETKAAGKEQDATDYIEYAYQYPELCFGTDTDPQQGQLMYGEWTFMQMLEDDFGDSAVRDVWRNLAFQDGFAALGEMLSAHGETVVSTVARYRLKNLARDYELAPLFNATVWRENMITDLGRWSYTGSGIQELGANYFELQVPPGAYYIGLINDGGALEVWGVGVTLSEGEEGAKLDAIPLGRGGAFDTTGYDYTYVMVFNPTYDENVSVCDYADYDVDVTPAKSARNLARYSFDARFFAPLG
ncbi:MAG: DVUA0089 family protein [Chloroflexota bacterium]|nr:DVUA0089 family protein [Chloroflexota bacterium]